MRMYVFAKRNFKEIIRDPLTLFFGICFPLILLLLLHAIQVNIPVSMFEINALAPGIAVFGQSFLALFSGMLIAKDRTSSFLHRLFISPMRRWEFIAGYTLPLLPMAIIQALICLLAGAAMGMNLKYLPAALIALLPSAILFISLGLLSGSLLNDKQVGGFCGALLTNLSAWFSGIWFDVSLGGDIFAGIANILPFSHAVKAAQSAVTGNYAAVPGQLSIVCVYALGLFLLAAGAFKRRSV